MACELTAITDVRVFQIDPLHGHYQYLQIGEANFYDDQTGFTQGLNTITRYALQRLDNEYLLGASQNFNPVQLTLNEGLNELAVSFPLIWAVSLTNKRGFVNEWYGNSRLGKFGFIRATGDSGKSKVIWLNDLNSSGTFSSFLNTGVEVMLAPGMIGRLTVYRFAGMPPIQYSLDSGSTWVNFYGAWQWFGGALAPANAVY